jgi:hypothetical protein
MPQTMAQMAMIQMMVIRPLRGPDEHQDPKQDRQCAAMMPQTHPLLGTARHLTDDTIWRMPMMIAQMATMITRTARLMPGQTRSALQNLNRKMINVLARQDLIRADADNVFWDDFHEAATRRRGSTVPYGQIS